MQLLHLGLIDYQAAWSLQRTLADARSRGLVDDLLLTLEHPHTYTLGRSARREHLLLTERDCAARGIAVIDVDRGGDITYHGPGQLVAYPICYLGEPDATGRLLKADYIGYIRRLEEVLIRTVAYYGIQAHREPGLTGVWVNTPAGLLKIAAIGVRVNARGVSTHGVALNLTTDLAYFDGIIPCGIQDKGVTSIAALTGNQDIPIDTAAERFAAEFCRVFGCSLTTARPAAVLAAAGIPEAEWPAAR